MGKSRHEQTTERSTTDDAFGMDPMPKALLSEAHLRLFNQIEQLDRTWRDMIDRLKQSEAELAGRLSGQHNKEMAVDICREWFSSKAATLLAESQRATNLWLTFYAGSLGSGWIRDTLAHTSLRSAAGTVRAANHEEHVFADHAAAPNDAREPGRRALRERLRD